MPHQQSYVIGWIELEPHITPAEVLEDPAGMARLTGDEFVTRFATSQSPATLSASRDCVCACDPRTGDKTHTAAARQTDRGETVPPNCIVVGDLDRLDTELREQLNLLHRRYSRPLHGKR